MLLCLTQLLLRHLVMDVMPQIGSASATGGYVEDACRACQ
jgi:hypothetical protein